MRKLIAMMVVISTALLIFVSNVHADYYSDYVTLRYGMWHDEVSVLQNDLKSLGYFNYYPTGYFGTHTNVSVKSYQSSKGLAVDGIVGRHTARALKIDRILQMAKSYQGVRYSWGGQSPSGFDCSGFVHYVLLKNDIIVPRTAAAQYNSGTWVNKSQLQPGDLVFFSTYKAGPSHVGFYLGGGKFIHASSGAGKIIISELSNSYYAAHYIGAKRVIN